MLAPSRVHTPGVPARAMHNAHHRMQCPGSKVSTARAYCIAKVAGVTLVGSGVTPVGSEFWCRNTEDSYTGLSSFLLNFPFSNQQSDGQCKFQSPVGEK